MYWGGQNEMKRFLRCTIYGFVPATLAALVLGVPTAAPDLGLQNVNLSCNDGTNLALALDAATVTQLSDAVGAINLFPAGDPALACSLTQSTTLTSSAARTFSSSRTFSSASSPSAAGGNGGNPQHDYAVGGGQAPNLGICGGVPTNFSLSAHVDAGTNTQGVGGTFNVTAPASTAPPGCAGTFVSKVDCLRVSGNRADLTAQVTHANGDFAFLVGFEISVAVLDSTPDMIDDSGASSSCDFSAVPDQIVMHGNISVHEAP
jgi:hypothetical protein